MERDGNRVPRNEIYRQQQTSNQHVRRPKRSSPFNPKPPVAKPCFTRYSTWTIRRYEEFTQMFSSIRRLSLTTSGENIPKLIVVGRSKWQRKKRQVERGDVVLIVENNVPRGKWNRGWVVKVFSGKDSIVRNVVLKTKNSELKGSVQKCCFIVESK